LTPDGGGAHPPSRAAANDDDAQRPGSIVHIRQGADQNLARTPNW
jgi:hypothetical protein